MITITGIVMIFANWNSILIGEQYIGRRLAGYKRRLGTVLTALVGQPLLGGHRFHAPSSETLAGMR